MPLWMSEDRKEIICVGSIEELEALTGQKITDIHRESIDHLTIPSKRPGHPPLKRVSEVFDCWFESGSMPYAQLHYPFEKTKEFKETFPADFIAEGIDQTRGWFYTLLVISTALFDKPPFKNLVCNGLVLASDGQKMSKSKKNYPDPMEVVNRFGADALRLYLINSPVVRAENLRFKEEGVRDIIKDVFLPWYNAFRFLLQNIERYETEEKTKFVYNDTNSEASDNIMDKWIVSFTQTLLDFMKNEMKAYRLYTVVPKLIKYIDNLTNWYVRMNRRRIKGDNGPQDCRNALNTLFSVIYTMIRINAPFTPFLSEFMYQRLPKSSAGDSVHYLMIPEPNLELIDEKIERSVSYMQTVIELGRIVRDRKTIPVKYPLPEIVVIHQDEKILEEIVSLKSYILEELNVKELTVTVDKQKYGVSLRAEPDHKTLGFRLKGEFKGVIQGIKDLSDGQLQEFLLQKKISVNGQELGEEDLRIMFSFAGPTAQQLSMKYEAHCEGNVLILLDVTPDEGMQHEGIAREVINRVQKLRKKAQLVPSDEADVYYEVLDKKSDLCRVVEEYKEFIEGITKTPQKGMKEMPDGVDVILEEMQKIKGVEMKLVLVKKGGGNQVFSKFVNVVVEGLDPRFGGKSSKGMILLENPKTGAGITLEQLIREINVIFGLYNRNFEVYFDGNHLKNGFELQKLNKKMIFVVKTGETPGKMSGEAQKPFCRVVNVKIDGRKCSVLTENPQGFLLNCSGDLEKIRELLGTSKVELV